jgi:hypothetical protein
VPMKACELRPSVRGQALAPFPNLPIALLHLLLAWLCIEEQCRHHIPFGLVHNYCHEYQVANVSKISLSTPAALSNPFAYVVRLRKATAINPHNLIADFKACILDGDRHSVIGARA